MIYFDNAASTWPKPPEVEMAMMTCIREYAANPGRGGHQLSIRAGRTLFQCRNLLAKLFAVTNPNDISFFPNATGAINQGIQGLLQEGDHVITTMIEHNSVRRPLEYLSKLGKIELSYVEVALDGTVSLKELDTLIKPNTKLLVVSHASNLLGTIIPIGELGRWAKGKGIVFMVDASQSAGAISINVERDNIDLLAFPGHKGLYGPQGTGGLYIHPSLELTPLILGGTGSHSESIDQPKERPERFESGTPNTVGIAGLAAGVEFVLKTGVGQIWEHEQQLTQYCLSELINMDGITVYGPPPGVNRTAVISFNLEGLDPNELAFILDDYYGIAVRAGFHCTPLAHETAGTSQLGSVRISFSYFNTVEEVNRFIEVMKEIKKQM
ncbi:aminotransferase class V-fold PLP-dependent enzyme [Microaerobacter geothermalis]|uniref:aminotransferase class V-fold PLP-dependent enzyme n=1 Tax=Microaerobacter geothermalis TaxID=674972 RepID=UPI001F20ACC1|nr:aminotransferase class V-fold PLP-dependent enzyme [Microaerobacter geothermalis]MCF6095106.1 aminotransferase class V-fold PLP-dependent enzyme [Microaerobacter geothermalis]